MAQPNHRRRGAGDIKMRRDLHKPKHQKPYAELNRSREMRRRRKQRNLQ